MKKFKIAIPPKSSCTYLTAGKNYEIIELGSDYFYIINDIGNKIYCLHEHCAHLCGKNWILK